jgi:hypothetical protein
MKTGGNFDEVLTRMMFEGAAKGGSMTLLRPDGSEYPGSPFTGGGLPGPWVATLDGNDNVWVSNFASANGPITELCGARTENCPPGFKTGTRFRRLAANVGGGLQMQTDLAIGPAGDVWVMDNWEEIAAVSVSRARILLFVYVGDRLLEGSRVDPEEAGEGRVEFEHQEDREGNAESAEDQAGNDQIVGLGE